MDGPTELTYPRVAAWTKKQGWIEIGRDDFNRSFIRVLDIGGMIWEGDAAYPSFDAALQAAEAAIEAWLGEQNQADTTP